MWKFSCVFAMIVVSSVSAESSSQKNFGVIVSEIKLSKDFSNESEKQAAINNLRHENELALKNNEKFDKGRSNFKQSVYEFSYLPPEEFYERYSGLKVQEYAAESRKSRNAVEKCENLPLNKNWIEEGKIPEVKNQLECKSSYLHAAVSAIESSVSIQYDISPVKLSTQHVLECIKNITYGDEDGCYGGYAELIWRFSKEQGGLVAERSYHVYNGNTQNECAVNLPRESNSEVDYWSLLPVDNEEALKCYVAKYGPVVAGISITGTSLPRYSEGIFDDPENACTANNPINHAVLIVGYGTEPDQLGIPTNYWLVQNSWGSQWGQQGYFKMVRGRNLCKIARYARFPVLKPKTNENLLNEIITPQICENFDDIFVNNAYLKSYCVVKIPQTYEDARVTCLKNGMKLFQLNPAESFSYDFTKIGSKSYMFIDGRHEQVCNSVSSKNEVKAENCGQLSWSICEYLNIEHFVELSQSIDSPGICSDVSQIYNEDSGYVKSLCLVEQNMNYVNASLSCTNNGMQLFQLDSDDAEAAATGFTRKLLESSISFYIKGRKHDKCASIVKEFQNTVLSYDSCENLSWFICELKEISPRESYLMPMYAPSDCVATGEVYSANVYRKSLCLIEKLLNYEEARENCISIGTRLYTLKSTDDISSLVNFSRKRWFVNAIKAHISRNDNLCTNINNQNGPFVFETKNCEAKGYSFCEFIEIENDLPLSPIEMPCTETLDVYNSMNIYEKSICLVTQPKNYTDARQNCMKNGMQLYRIVSTDTKLALMNFVNKKCAMEGVSSIFIKGRRGSDCSVLNKAEDIFFENYGKCAEQSWSICEYINSNAPEKITSQRLRPEICSKIGEIYNSSNSYEKSFCIVEWSQNYDESRQYCQKNGMKLFKFDSTEANKTVTEFVSKHVQKTSYFYLDGSTDNGCLNINNFYGEYYSVLSDCSSLMYSICEYSAIDISEVNSTTPINEADVESTVETSTPYHVAQRIAMYQAETAESIRQQDEDNQDTSYTKGNDVIDSETTGFYETTTEISSEYNESGGGSMLLAVHSENVDNLVEEGPPQEPESPTISEEFHRLQSKGLLYSQDIFGLASKIKKAFEGNLSQTEETEMLTLKSNLPESVQILIWNEDSVISNENYVDEYLYASNFLNDKHRRFALSWIPGGETDKQASWVFSTYDNGVTFKIKNVFVNEYLYPDTTFKDNSHRYVFTWRNKTLEPEFFWNIELLSNDRIRIKSATFNEYFYAESQKYAYSPNRRSVFTGFNGHVCDNSCSWVLRRANNSTKSEITSLHDDIERELYRLKTENLTYSSSIFPLASKIKQAFSMNLSRHDNEKFLALKSQLPTCVHILIWNLKTKIYNEAYPEELMYAASTYKDDKIRHVFSGINEVDSDWIFSSGNNGETFSIKNTQFQEYLFPNQNEVRGRNSTEVYLWHPENLQSNFQWTVEVVEDSKVRLKSIENNEYLFTPLNSHTEKVDEKVIETGLRVDHCDERCNWILKI